MISTSTPSLEDIKATYLYPDSKFVHVKGMDVHYRDVGSGPVLVLLHGMFASLHTWEKWIEVLQNDFRVIALDNPNYGITGPHPEPMRPGIYSDFLKEFLDALDIQECMMCGNSLGGWMTWEFTSRFPERVKKIILIDSAGYLFFPTVTLMLLALPFAVQANRFIRAPRFFIKRVLKSVYGNPQLVKEETVDLYHTLLMRPGNMVAATKVVHFIRNQVGFRTGNIKKIQQPALVMWGEKDRWIPLRHVKSFMRNLVNGQSVTYPDLGHVPMEENPDACVEDARKFLLKD